MSANKPRAILTPEFRLSFCNLFLPKADMNGVVRFQMEMLFPKAAGASQFKDMKDLYDEALANAKFSGAGPAPRSFKDAIIDGNSKKQDGRHGMWMVKANASAEINGRPNAPRVLLASRMPATQKDVYEGCWCRAIISAYTYEARKDGKANAPIISRGAAYNMLTVQKVRDDKPFAGFVTEDEQDELLKASPLDGADEDINDLLG